MRKTINVESVRILVNSMLSGSAQDDHVDRAYREGAISVLEEILHESGNYRGFRYLTAEELPKSCIPGVHRDEGLSHEEKFINTDGTRRFYF